MLFNSPQISIANSETRHWRSNCSQISYFCDGLNNRFPRRFRGPDIDSFSDMN